MRLRREWKPHRRGKQRYRYDAQNRLIAVESATVGAEFFYDAHNRCVLRKYFDRSTNGSWALNTADSRALTYDTRWNLLAERTLDGRSVGEYVHGARVDEILQWTGSDGAKLCPLADGLGSVVALTDRQGRVIERYRYTAYGELVGLNADYRLAPSTYRFLYTGREWLAPIGLNEHRNRYYSPTLGRWTSRDPIYFQGRDASIYRYVTNRPVSHVDPWGLKERPRYSPDAPPYQHPNTATPGGGEYIMHKSSSLQLSHIRVA